MTFVYSLTMAQDALSILGEVLRRARESLGRSPEQVGALVGISGRTIRRLEVGTAGRPRRVTLEALAGFYGLNPDVIVDLADSDEDELLESLRGRISAALGPGVAEALKDVEDEAVELAMRLARLSGSQAGGLSPERGRTQFVISYLRGGGQRSSREQAEAVDAIVDFLALDSARRSVARQLLRDLRAAQEAASPTTEPE